MVTLNATIVVLLAMFLGFLWIMHRLIFKPLLAHMDARSDQIAEDRRMAAEAASEADQLEDQYAGNIARIHREANLHLLHARREAQETHLARVTEYRAKAEAEIAALNRELSDEIARQEEDFPGMVEEIHAAMAARLKLE